MFFRKTTNPELQLYGKLPLAKDYLRIGCSDGHAQELRDWMDRQFSTDVDGPGPRLAFPMGMLLGHRGSESFVGCMFNSSDEGGHRGFPFMLGIDQGKKDQKLWTDVGVGGLDALYGALQRVYGAWERFEDGREFLEKHRGIVPDWDVVEEEDGLDLQVWSEALFPGSATAGLEEIVSGIGQLESEGHEGALRLPLVSGWPVAEQVSAWVGLLDEMRFARGESLALFFPVGRTEPEDWSFLTVLPGAVGELATSWLAAVEGDAVREIGDCCGGEPRATEEDHREFEDQSTLRAQVLEWMAARDVRSSS